MFALPAAIGMIGPGRSGGEFPAYRHWRIYITDNNGAAYTSLTEVELRSNPGGPDQSSPSGASASSDYFAANGSLAFNGNTSDTSAWVSSNSSLPQWLANDLGSTKSVAQVAIWPETSDDFARAPKNFEIQACDDGVSWETIKTYTDVTGWSGYGNGGGGYRTFSTV